MVNHWLRSLLIMMSLLVVSSVVFAENVEQKDDSFKYSTVYNVYIEPDLLLNDDVSMPDLDKLKATKAMSENIKYLKNYTISETPEKADVSARVIITSWGYESKWHEPEEYITHETITHTDKDGKTSVTTIPIKRERPGYTATVGFFSATFEALDKNGVVIYQRIDSREDYKKPYDMFNRAVQDFYKAFNKLKS